jgi:glycosyltransferase involved in cell wall biosynthesis
VGARVGGIPELIEDMKNGRLFPHKDSAALAKIIRELWEHPELTEHYSAECRKLQRDGLPEYSEKLIQVYEGEHGNGFKC